jgi:hypothetical protein
MRRLNWISSRPSLISCFPSCPSFWATSKEERPSIIMKPGLEKRRNQPHQDAADVTHGLMDVDEKMLNERRSRKGCIGGCRTESTDQCDENQTIVPCMRAWMTSSKELVRKAVCPRTESVSGRYSKICSTVESWAVPVTAFQMIDGADMRNE